MTSLHFFDHSNIEPRPAVDWGTADLQSEKFDPTVIKGPTFILKNQPITQFYRESNIELSNVRTNDQLMPAPLKENLLEKKILQRFPMNHPFTSQISLKALFPNFTAPEDAKRGELALNTRGLLDKQTPAQVDDTIIINKQSGKPWRQEMRYPALPSFQKGVWYNDNEYYHYPKPNYNQQFYPAPLTLLKPNPRLRTSHSIDSRTANVLRNKEKELMQSSQRIDYYKDGLGSRAVLNSDDMHEKRVRFADSGDISEDMRPYFRKGAGITKATIEPVEDDKSADQEQIRQNLVDHVLAEPQPVPLTKVEKDQIIIEHGTNYKNFPEQNYLNNPSVPSFNAPRFEFTRSKTMPELKTTVEYKPEEAKKIAVNKLDAEKRKIATENHDRIQSLEYENRRREIELVGTDNDIRVLRLNNRELENSRGAQPNLKQNYKQHVQSLYQQEAKFLGERAELYKPHTYNPHMLKQYIESVKDDSKVSATHTNGAGYASQKDSHLPNDTYEHRPKLFADKVFSDYKNAKREPLETVLLNPNVSSEPVHQENGFIQQQTTYGHSYSTKKFLQENELVPLGNSNMDMTYSKLDQAELDFQNIALKSKADQIAFYDYKNGLTPEANNMRRANELVDRLEKEAKETEYPRFSGPIPPEPYEALYCNTHASELSDGNSKRIYSRVYDSPNVKPTSRFEPLWSDLDAIHKYEQKAINDLVKHEEHMRQIQEQTMQNAQNQKITLRDRNSEITTRRSLDKISVMQQEQRPTSTYSASYTNYSYDELGQCPPNEFYKNIHYTQTPLSEAKMHNDALPKNLIGLQDSWSKSLANLKYYQAHPSSAATADLRENIHAGKKIIYTAPANAYRFA